MAWKMCVINKIMTEAKGFVFVPKKTRVDYGVSRKMGVALLPQ
jgi:hypothetical protein